MDKTVRARRSWRFRMSREVVASSAKMLALTCLVVAVLSSIFDQSAVRDIRLLACALVGGASVGAIWLIKKRRFNTAVAVLLVSLYAASAAGAIGTQTGLRAPSLLVLSMFSLICAFAFTRWLSIACIGLNVAYLVVLLVLEKKGIIDPLGHLNALNSMSVFIVLVTLSVIFGMMGFPLGRQIDRAMHRMQESRRHLAASREMYRSLFDGAPLGVVNFDADGLITSVNPMVAQWSGIPESQWSGVPVSRLLQQDLPDAFCLPRAKALKCDVQMARDAVRLSNGSTQKVEPCATDKTDDDAQGMVWLSATVSAFPHDANGYRGGVVLLLDDSERKRSELELIRAKEAAEAAAHAKTRFLSHMSHELRTPMTGIIGSLDLVRDQRVTPEKRQRMLGLLDTSAKSMLRLLDDILDSARLGEGRLRLESVAFSPHALVMHAQQLFRVAAETRGLAVVVQVDANPDLYCMGDAARLRQVMGILMDNAIRFTDRGSITIHASLVLDAKTYAVNVTEPGTLFRVSVKDTGIGMTEEQIAQMFQPFTELGLKRAENQRGAGLGLSIAKGLVELMGGQIGVSSVVSKGSEFWFEVPLPLKRSQRREKNENLVG